MREGREGGREAVVVETDVGDAWEVGLEEVDDTEDEQRSQDQEQQHDQNPEHAQEGNAEEEQAAESEEEEGYSR